MVHQRHARCDRAERPRCARPFSRTRSRAPDRLPVRRREPRVAPTALLARVARLRGRRVRGLPRRADGVQRALARRARARRSSRPSRVPRRARGRRRAARAAAAGGALARPWTAACAATVALCAADALTRPLSELEWSGGLRPVVLFCFAPAARDALATCARVMPGVLAVVALELYVVLVYACLCVMLYGADGGKGDGGEGGSSPFGSLSDAFVALFALSTTVNDPDVWLPLYARRGWSAVVVFGSFIVVQVSPSCAQPSCSRVGDELSPPPLSLSGLPRAQPRARDRVQHVRREPRRAAPRARGRAPRGARRRFESPPRRAAAAARHARRAHRRTRRRAAALPALEARGAVRAPRPGRARRGAPRGLRPRARRAELARARALGAGRRGRRGRRRAAAARAARGARAGALQLGNATASSSRARAGGAPGRAASCGSCSRRSRSSRPSGRPARARLGWRVCLENGWHVVALASSALTCAAALGALGALALPLGDGGGADGAASRAAPPARRTRRRRCSCSGGASTCCARCGACRGSPRARHGRHDPAVAARAARRRTACFHVRAARRRSARSGMKLRPLSRVRVARHPALGRRGRRARARLRRPVGGRARRARAVPPAQLQHVPRGVRHALRAARREQLGPGRGGLRGASARAAAAAAAAARSRTCTLSASTWSS